MKVGDLVKMKFESSAMGIITQRAEGRVEGCENRFSNGDWVVLFTTLGYDHPCYEHELEVISECG